MKKSKRVFKPASKYIRGFEGDSAMLTHIENWIWTTGAGLRCVYKDGICTKSDYTLKELLKIERPIETEAGL